MAPAAHADKASLFQVKLKGDWKNYSKDEDRALKRAFLAGFPHARFSLRGYAYECDFAKMTQKNLGTGKAREVRPPHRWTAPPKPVCKAGPTMCIRVPDGAAGSTIHVPHPKAEGQFISVAVPPAARPGQSMLVPIPHAKPVAEEPAKPAAEEPAKPAAEEPVKQEKKAGWSTGAKAAAVGGVAAVAVAGALLGEHIAEEGWDATLDDLGDAATAAGEGIADGAEEAVDWVGDAGETVGDFIMDLF